MLVIFMQSMFGVYKGMISFLLTGLKLFKCSSLVDMQVGISFINIFNNLLNNLKISEYEHSILINEDSLIHWTSSCNSEKDDFYLSN